MGWLTPERLRLIAVVLLVQGLFWFVISPAFVRAPRPVDRIEITSSSVARIASPDWKDVESATFTPVELPYEDCCKEGFQAIKVTFNLDKIPETGLAEIPVIGADNYTARINGSLHWAEGNMALDELTYHGRVQRGINRLPKGLLKLGENELVYTLASSDGRDGVFIAAPNLGEYNAMADHFAFRDFILNDYLLISIVIGYLLALLCWFAWLRSNRRPFLFWLGTLSFLWAFGLHQQDWAYWPFDSRLLVLIGAASLLALPVSWTNLVNSWLDRRLRYVLPISLAAFVASLVAFWLLVSNPSTEASAIKLIFWMQGLGTLGVFGLLAWKLPSVKREAHWEFAIFAGYATFLLRDSVVRIFEIQLGRTTDYVLPFMLIALAGAYLSRNIRLFRSSEQINTLLQTQLDERTAELAVAHDREKQLLRGQAHQEERQRILRDMHDGLGSSLMSMLLAARRGKAEPEKVASGLESVIDEMRLLIDSMDTVGESLNSALTLFRNRAKERVPEGGFAFEWTDNSGGALPEMPPRAVLQVFRILQEALTNALKHSDGDRIEVLVESDAISVIDNGSRFDGPRDGGRGLENMAARAGMIGGSFAVSRKGDTTVARIELPVPGFADPAALPA